MNNLFSMFDPNSLFSIPMNWISAPLGLLLIPSGYWLTKNQFHMVMKEGLLFIKNEFNAIMGPLGGPGSIWPPLSLFFLILTMNFSGLLPYVFPPSSHLVLSVSLALPMWLGHMVYSWATQPNFMLAHLVPLGTPGVLMPFMVMIEMVSSIIRPLTLSVRLAANIIAGHLLLTLLSSQAPSGSLLVIFIILTSLIALSILESAVAVIQAYVFSVLSTLYLSEVASKKL